MVIHKIARSTKHVTSPRIQYPTEVAAGAGISKDVMEVLNREKGAFRGMPHDEDIFPRRLQSVKQTGLEGCGLTAWRRTIQSQIRHIII